MSENIYRLQTLDGKGYRQAPKEKVNNMIERGEAEWVGSDYEEDKDLVIHYADRIPE